MIAAAWIWIGILIFLWIGARNLAGRLFRELGTLRGCVALLEDRVALLEASPMAAPRGMPYTVAYCLDGRVEHHYANGTVIVVPEAPPGWSP